MGRKAAVPMVIENNIDTDVLENGTRALLEDSTATQFFLDKAELMQQVGRIQGIDFTRRVGDIAMAKIFEEIRLSKKYKDLPYLDEKGNTRLSGSLDEFCRVFLGKSYNRCLELSQNLHLLGEELYESTQKLNFRAKDYAALRALPADEQAIIKQAIETESREAVIELIEDMAVRHAAEKEKLQKELSDTREDKDAVERVLAKRNEQLDLAQARQEKLKPPTPDEEGAQLRREASDWVCNAEAVIRGTLRDGIQQLRNHGEANQTTHEEFLSGLLAQLQRALNDVRSEFLIKQVADGSNVPEWAK